MFKVCGLNLFVTKLFYIVKLLCDKHMHVKIIIIFQIVCIGTLPLYSLKRKKNIITYRML